MFEAGGMPRIGDEFAGYRIESLLGRGGMGVVYLATHARLNRRVALKVLTPELADDESFHERFIRESQIAASLDHPNVIPIYDADEADGVLYIAMRYVEGESLRQTIRRTQGMTQEETLQIIRQVASALDAAHDAGLVHRDVKPANILIAERSAHTYLCDFGLAKRAASQGMTRTGTFLGTADYCAPEQIEGKPVDGRTDVYALGAVTFHCLAGHPPFVRETEIAVVHAHIADPPPALTTLRPDLPPAVDGVIATAMAKYPEVRYDTAGQMVAALDESLDHGPTTVARATTPLPVAARANPIGGTSQPTNAVSPEHARTTRLRATRRVWLSTAAVLIVFAAAAGAVLATRGGSTHASKARNSTPPPPPPRVHSRPAPSPAGPSGRLYEITNNIKLYSGPSTNSRQVGAISKGRRVGVQCKSYGQAVNGPYNNASHPDSKWDWVIVAGTAGFAPDEWVDTKLDELDSAKVPFCSAVNLASFANVIESILQGSAKGRSQINADVQSGRTCNLTPMKAAQAITPIVANRDALLKQVDAILVPTPQAKNLVKLLKSALTASIAADRSYRAWFSALAQQPNVGCPYRATAASQQAVQDDRNAIHAKQAFTAAFNRVARRFRLRQWSASAF